MAKLLAMVLLRHNDWRNNLWSRPIPAPSAYPRWIATAMQHQNYIWQTCWFINMPLLLVFEMTRINFQKLVRFSWWHTFPWQWNLIYQLTIISQIC